MRVLILMLLLPGLALAAPTEEDAAAIEGLASIGPEARQLGMRDAIRDALADNLGLQSRVKELDAASFRLKASWAPFLPYLMAGANFQPSKTESLEQLSSIRFWQRNDSNQGSYNVGVGTNLFTGTNVTLNWAQGGFSTTSTLEAYDDADAALFEGQEPTEFSTAWSNISLNINQSLLQGIDPNYQLRGVGKAKVALNSVELTRDQDVANVVANVLKYYWDLVALRRNVEIKRISKRLAEEQRGVTQARIAAGDLAPIEVFRIDETVATRSAELLEALRTAEEMEQSFKLLLGIGPEDERFRRPLRPIEGITSALPTRDRERSLQVALERNPGLVLQRHQLENGEIDQRSARHELLPDLDLTAALAVSGRGDNQTEALQDINETKFPDFRLGVEFTMPLPDLGAIHSLQAANLDVERSQLQVESAEQEVLAGVESAFRSMRSYDQQVQVAAVRTELASRNADAAEATYQAGRSTLRDVLEAQQALEEARQAEVAAQVQALKARVDLEIVRGTLLDALGVEYR